jgi:tetratricopeptide (TPR) repeat protein
MVEESQPNVFDEVKKLTRIEDIPRKVNLCRAALDQYSRTASPEKWADLQIELGICHLNNLSGERGENIEQAFLCFEQALQVYTRDTNPRMWASLQVLLAEACMARMRGERGKNVEAAIEYYTHASEVYTVQAYPLVWAGIQINLANTYQKRVKGTYSDNLAEAIRYCEQGLSVYTKQAFPVEYANTHINLADIYTQMRVQRVTNLGLAIEHYVMAFEIYNRRDYPVEWAKIQNNLGLIFADGSLAGQAGNIEKSITYFTRALEVFKKEIYPDEWATTQNNLALSYELRLRGQRAQNVDIVVDYYRAALTVRTPRFMPQKCLLSAYQLGRLFFDQGRYHEAREALVLAHDALNAMQGNILIGIEWPEFQEQNNDLYARLVSCCLREGDMEAALGYATIAKGRPLIDLLDSAGYVATSHEDNLLQEALIQLQEINQQIDHYQVYLGSKEVSGKVEKTSEVIRRLESLAYEKKLLRERIAMRSPSISITQQPRGISTEQAKKLAAILGAPLVEYYRHKEGWGAFVVTQNEVNYIPLPRAHDRLMRESVNWVEDVVYPAGQCSQYLDVIDEWYEALIVPLKAYFPPRGGVVFLAPYGEMNRLPLIAAHNQAEKSYLLQEYAVLFAPNLSVLNMLVEQRRRSKASFQMPPKKLLTVAYSGDPTGEHFVPNAAEEIKSVVHYFSQATTLSDERATPEEFISQTTGQEIIHFGTEAWYEQNWQERMGLRMGGWLTVQRILNELHFNQTRLVTLGSALTTRWNMRHINEMMVLVQSLFCAGAPVVAANLWTVNNTSKQVVNEVFYAGVAAGNPPVEALREATRTASGRKGWEHPYYWANMMVYGLGHLPRLEQYQTGKNDLNKRVKKIKNEDLSPGRFKDAEMMVTHAVILGNYLARNPSHVLGDMGTDRRQVLSRTLLKIKDIPALASEAKNLPDLLRLAHMIILIFEESTTLRGLFLPENYDSRSARAKRESLLRHYPTIEGEDNDAKERAAEIRDWFEDFLRNAVDVLKVIEAEEEEKAREKEREKEKKG